MKSNNKKVLIISNNPLSKIQNNGKTIASLFENFNSSNIYQIYFNESLPDYDDKCHYFQITELSIIKSFFKKSEVGKEVKSVSFDKKNINKKRTITSNLINVLKQLNFVRLLREVVWKTNKWKNDSFTKWILQEKFDIILFLAGDSLFAYDIYLYVTNHIKSRSTIFITDDYILKKTFNIFALIRKNLIKANMKKAIERSNVMLTISDEMSNKYYDIFNKKSLISRNFYSTNKKFNKIRKVNNNSNIILTYAGGFHYNRWKVLAYLGRELDKFNANSEKKAVLNVYSSQNLTYKMKKEFDGINSLVFNGCVNSDTLNGIYHNSDILVHVESFDKKAIQSTMYSFSTKIPEYLSVKKCVLAIGPKEVSSMKYLSKCAICINNLKDGFSIINKLLSSSDVREDCSKKCFDNYVKTFSIDQKNIIINEIVGE